MQYWMVIMVFVWSRRWVVGTLVYLVRMQAHKTRKARNVATTKRNTDSTNMKANESLADLQRKSRDRLITAFELHLRANPQEIPHPTLADRSWEGHLQREDRETYCIYA